MSGQTWVRCTHQEAGTCADCVQAVVSTVERLTRERDEERARRLAYVNRTMEERAGEFDAKAALIARANAAERERDEARHERDVLRDIALKAERERDEARALLQAATDNAFDAGAKAQGLEDSHRFVAMRKERDEAERERDKWQEWHHVAVRERDEYRADIKNGMRIAWALTQETQTVEDMATDLVRQVREARQQRDEARELYNAECNHSEGLSAQRDEAHREREAETANLMHAEEERDALHARVEQLHDIVKQLLPVPGFPKCDSRCASNSSSYEEDPRCDCGMDEIRTQAEKARALLKEMKP